MPVALYTLYPSAFFTLFQLIFTVSTDLKSAFKPVIPPIYGLVVTATDVELIIVDEDTGLTVVVVDSVVVDEGLGSTVVEEDTGGTVVVVVVIQASS